eukprot:Blabericola_migrator_1__10853@NODE_624_length_7189_cov_211_722269_g455_i0_p5_GENE_NODE_624_length_7189_cov_211_722269_g455_i0NODE_624_length_7189_cov_211_722269_g455_i0_p5_ORF_typecomplete_len122_score21_24C2/PF00168_30/1e07_NODE_624_length_7189_cov_211_722269_g455_i066387003
MTILQLTVHVGTDMKKNSILARIDKLDPYVKIEIGDQKLQGSVHQNAGGTAYFGETLTTDWDGNSEAKIVVKDDNLLKDVTVGEVVIGAADLKQPTWHGWRDLTKDGKKTGTLLITTYCEH